MGLYEKVQVGKDQEKAQSERDSHSKTEVGKNQANNDQHRSPMHLNGETFKVIFCRKWAVGLNINHSKK